MGLPQAKKYLQGKMAIREKYQATKITMNEVSEVPSLHEVQNVIAASFCAVPAWQGRQEEDMFAG